MLLNQLPRISRKDKLYTATVELLDKFEICEVYAKYARAVDRCEPELLKEVFHEDAMDVHFRVANPARQFISDCMDLLKGLGLTVHYFRYPLVTIRGDVAYSEVYAIAFHRINDPNGEFESVFGARAYDRFERRDGVWKIAHRLAIYDWNRDVPVNQTWNKGTFGPGISSQGRQDKGDPLYRFMASQGISGDSNVTIAQSASMEDRLQVFLDKQEIYELLATYIRAVDRCDEELLLSVYHDDAVDIRYGKKYAVKDFCKYWVGIKQDMGNSAHYLSYPLIEIHGDVALAECYVMAVHKMHGPDGDYDSIWGERVLDRYERRNGQWKVALRETVCDWNNDVPSSETWSRGYFAQNISSEAQKGRADPLYSFLASQR